MNRKISFDDAYTELLGSITTVIKDILVQKTMSARELALRAGIAQPTVSRLFTGSSAREWRLEHLARIAYSQGLSLTDIIEAAECGTTISSDIMTLAGTEPGTPERLDKLLRYPTTAGMNPGVAEVLLTSAMMKLVVPEVYDGYAEGVFSDGDIKKVVKVAREKCGSSFDAFWGVFKEECIAAGYAK